MTDFSKPTEKEMPLSVDVVAELMPARKDIPEEFVMCSSNPWIKWQSKWMFEGIKSVPEPKEGIDGRLAMRHLASIQRSWQPKHEHKVEAVAYLASLWFKSPEPA